jgi:hypothetical protein
MSKRKTTKEFIQDARRVHGDRYDYSKVVYVYGQAKVKIICPEKGHGIFEKAPCHHLRGQGCPKCAFKTRCDARRLSTSAFVSKAKKVHGSKYDYSKTIYVTCCEEVTIICRVDKHGTFKPIAGNHVGKGQGCPACTREETRRRMLSTFDEFIHKARKIHGYKYDYSSVTYVAANKKVKIICPEKGHGCFKQTPNGHLRTQGCPACGLNQAAASRTTPAEKILRIERAHPSVRVIGKIIGTQDKVDLFCEVCKKLWSAKPNNVSTAGGVARRGCPHCCWKRSKGEKQIMSFLDSVGLAYKCEKTFATCRNKNPLMFDFYIPELRVLIEFHGKQHFKPVEFFGGKSGFRERKKHDHIKKQWAQKNNYELIEIKYDEVVEEVLATRLRVSLPKAA